MPRKSYLHTRADDLEEEIRDFERLVNEARGAGQFSAAIAGQVKIAAMRKQLADIRQEIELATIRDEVRRLEALRSRAAADGSYGPAASLGEQLERARARQEAEEAARKEAAKKTPEQIIERVAGMIVTMPDSMRERLFDRIAELRKPKPLPSARPTPEQ
jgi:hypothetical protein